MHCERSLLGHTTCHPLLLSLSLSTGLRLSPSVEYLLFPGVVILFVNIKYQPKTLTAESRSWPAAEVEQHGKGK